MRSQRGLSLIELMVALAIGALLLLGLFQVFSASNMSAQMGAALSRVQENGRFALDFMRTEIRMAGHMGCTSGSALVRDIDLAPTQMQSAMQIGNQQVSFRVPTPAGRVAPPFIYDFRYDVQGYEANGTASNTATPNDFTLQLPPVTGIASNWTPELPDDLLNLNPRPIAGSDIVVIRYGLPGEMQLIGGFTTGNPLNPVVAITNGRIPDSGQTFVGVNQTGVPFVAAACAGNTQALAFIGTSIVETADRMTVTGNNTLNWPEIAAEGLSSSQEGSATLVRMEFVAYYVGLNANNIPALYRVSFGPAVRQALAPLVTEELVEGVDSLQISYGVEIGPIIPPVAGAPPRPQVAAQLSSRADVYATAAQLHEVNGPVAPLLGRHPIEVWRRVMSVRIGLLARSTSRISGVGTDAQGPYVVNGVRIALSNQDALMRQGYEEVITVRNRLRNLNTLNLNTP
ncbi:MAG: PilW family protein [Xanthomonadales bacterium]|jgi:type IV pilus assembly protein PilW|nr:PilW family protein [Xanthomonadales bacterium]